MFYGRIVGLRIYIELRVPTVILTADKSNHNGIFIY
jgi:hypothetical protein